ncbi:class I SAM-dependent methyltransferase [Pelomonas sp. BJYL3]|uniref:class I SAM-dependent methyltransferase n=1 Tax=Pelomonas sp. BJYL3 TaxID=2976697 RepID=UPI0022B41CF3|nr:class I SAM-dependent methyltransferase [Pelomonas sp. BJYL3]
MFDISTLADQLTLGPDGIWRSIQQESISYPSGGNEACLQIEESSFWFRHRNACIAAAVRNFPPGSGELIFDIGGGNGFVSRGLNQAGFDTALVEPGPCGAVNAKRRGIPTVICATTRSAGFKPSTLGAVGLFDVIEHIEDDLQFLKEIRELVKLGGRLYLTVPAYRMLWSAEDAAAGHFRRYTRASIASLVQRAGFAVEYSSYLFRFLPLPIFLFRALPYRLGIGRSRNDAAETAEDHRPPQGRAAALLDALLARELGHVEHRRHMVFGGSCLLVANAR